MAHAGTLIGTFVVVPEYARSNIKDWFGVSGNAKQRRKQIRKWKATGMTVRHLGSTPYTSDHQYR